MYSRVIFQTDDKRFRILEHIDECFDFEDLCGDTYKPECHPEIPKAQILAELEQFKDLVEREGVYGYELQRWNPEPGQGYEHMDSCFGFVGQYSESDETFRHYIVDEMKETISRYTGSNTPIGDNSTQNDTL
jgi:hypothetical protein